MDGQYHKGFSHWQLALLEVLEEAKKPQAGPGH